MPTRTPRHPAHHTPPQRTVQTCYSTKPLPPQPQPHSSHLYPSVLHHPLHTTTPHPPAIPPMQLPRDKPLPAHTAPALTPPRHCIPFSSPTANASDLPTPCILMPPYHAHSIPYLALFTFLHYTFHLPHSRGNTPLEEACSRVRIHVHRTRPLPPPGRRASHP